MRCRKCNTYPQLGTPVHAGPDLAFRIPDVEGCPPAEPMSELLAFMQHETQEAAKAGTGMLTGQVGLLVASKYTAGVSGPYKCLLSRNDSPSGDPDPNVCEAVMPKPENGGVAAHGDVEPAATPEQAKEPQRQEDIH